MACESQWSVASDRRSAGVGEENHRGRGVGRSGIGLSGVDGDTDDFGHDHFDQTADDLGALVGDDWEVLAPLRGITWRGAGLGSTPLEGAPTLRVTTLESRSWPESHEIEVETG